MNAKEFVEQVHQEKIDPVVHTKKVLFACKKLDAKNHYFNTLTEDLALRQANNVKKTPSGKLAGLCISVKDNICIKDVETTAGSRILKGYKPLFTATAVQRLIEEGAIIIGKTAQDEFGFGSFSLNVGKGFKQPTHPTDPTRVTGGSSGGAAGLTRALDLPHVALGQSTGGSIVNPASFCGVFGLCPTYGVVSRFGLIDYGNSFDRIGPIGKTLDDVELVYDVLVGKDTNDATTVEHPLPKPKSKPVIGIVKEYLSLCDKPVQEAFKAAVDKLKKQGLRVKDVKLPLTTEYATEVYYVLAISEASTNLAKLTGIRYGAQEALTGNYNEYFARVRGAYFGDEAKRRILLGTFTRMAGYRDALYVKAAQIRTLIIEEYKKVFSEVDALFTPTMPILAPKTADVQKLTPQQHYAMDILTVGPNLAGLPHLTVPIGEKSGLPVGGMLIGNHFAEKTLFAGARYL